jgi:hypothetical protein
MGDRRDQFAPAQAGRLSKNRGAYLARHVGKRVAVEKQEWPPPMERLEEIEKFEEGYFFSARFFPLLRARSSSLWINAVLRAASCARSSVEADNRLPTPVFDKSGSGL